MQSINTELRYDMYMAIHKALRAFMNDTLTAISRMDVEDASEISAALTQLRELLHICAKHLQHENRFVHAAMEKRKPGSTAHIAVEHIEHEHEIEHLRETAARFDMASGVQKRSLALVLYRELALFVAQNFEHMQYEESEHNAVLWSAYSDAELIAIEEELKASIQPQEMAIIARWMLCANDHAFRVAMLCGVRERAPREVFESLVQIARANLTDGDWQKLACAMELSRAA